MGWAPCRRTGAVRRSPAPEPMFQLDRFVSDCLAARGEPDYVHSLQAVLQGAIGDAAGISSAFASDQDEVSLIFHGDRMTIVHARISPNVIFPPHNHHMEAL